MRTSLTHPLEIASVRAGPGMGRVGLTLCPGKQQRGAATGAWARDLAADLDAIAEWGAVAVVTLLEPTEMKRLGVENLKAEVVARGMDWWHVPIRDGGVLDDEQSTPWWITCYYHLLPLLRDGFDVLVHCKGGLGRAGMIAGDLLVQLGMDADEAIELVRQARPGAIENMDQEHHVIRLRGWPEPLPRRREEDIGDRALGAMLGLAIGDALGTTLEFSRRDSQPPLTDIMGGGPFHLQPGQWTDDTAMALALAASLAANPLLDEADLMRRFAAWHERGEYSCTGTCFDIGITTRQALQRFKQTGNPLAGSADPMSAGNGSLMRLAPVAIRHWPDRAALRDIAARQSHTTHAAPEALHACIAFAEVLADAIEGRARSQVLREHRPNYSGNIAAVMAGSWRGKRRQEIRSTGYVAHSLEAALWCVGRTDNFRDAMLLAANLGDDADTVAAITGQLAGALHGAAAMPNEWLEKLAWREKIQEAAENLLSATALSKQ